MCNNLGVHSPHRNYYFFVMNIRSGQCHFHCFRFVCRHIFTGRILVKSLLILIWTEYADTVTVSDRTTSGIYVKEEKRKDVLKIQQISTRRNCYNTSLEHSAYICSQSSHLGLFQSTVRDWNSLEEPSLCRD